MQFRNPFADVAADLADHVADGEAHEAAAQAATISGGVLALAAYTKRLFVVSPESGSEDDLDKLTGLAAGDEVTLKAATGKAINVKNGAFMKVTTDFALTGYGRIRLQCDGSDVCVHISRSANP